MNNERLMQVLRSPVVSEKSNLGAAQRQYTFKVEPTASKPEIRKAVELMFDVKVEQVRVVNIIGKQKRFGRMVGNRSGVRKAYVKLAEGQSIDLGAA